MKITMKQLMFLIEHNLKAGIDPIPGREGYNAIAQGLNAIKKRKVKKSILQSLDDYANFAFADEDIPGQFGVAYDDYDTTKGVQAKELRRASKKIWNDNADHKFFRNNVAKLHQISYAHSEDSYNPGIDPNYLSGGGKTELSCWSLLTQNPFKPSVSELVKARLKKNSFYLVLDGRVTWCGNFDAFTEQLSAKKRLKDKKSLDAAKRSTASSGLPKRPGGVRFTMKNQVWSKHPVDEEGRYIIDPDWESTLLDPGEIDWEQSLKDTPIILDKEDFENIQGTRIADEYGLRSQETIIDNWTINNVLLILDKHTGFEGNNIEDRIKKLKADNKLGLLRLYGMVKYITQNQNIKVNVADLSQSRYLTDQEVQQIIDSLTNE